MTASDSGKTVTRGRLWRGDTTARRRALTAAGLERPAAELLVDMLDELRGAMLTTGDADSRFEAMLREHRAERARDRAEIRAEFAKMKGEMAARFGEVDARFGEVEARFGEVEARFGGVEAHFGGLEGRMEARFGEVHTALAQLRTDMEKLRADLTWRMLLALGALLAAATALDQLLG